MTPQATAGCHAPTLARGNVVYTDYAPMQIDYMVSSWDALTKPLETAAKPAKKRFLAFPGTDVETALKPTLPLCHYCNKPFQRKRSSQKFCTPSKERKLAWVRRQALIVALAEHFTSTGCTARNMLEVARKCIEAAYEAVYAAMVALGWKYNTEAKEWVYKGAK